MRVSFIEFLNAVPLGWGFLEGRHAGILDVAFDVPSECARRLAAGEADVGLIPVIECGRIPGLRVLPDICIASRQEVKSVLFVSKVPISRVSRLAVDRSSRTSAALLKIILERFHGRDSIEYVVEDPKRGVGTLCFVVGAVATPFGRLESRPLPAAGMSPLLGGFHPGLLSVQWGHSVLWAALSPLLSGDWKVALSQRQGCRRFLAAFTPDC